MDGPTRWGRTHEKRRAASSMAVVAEGVRCCCAADAPLCRRKYLELDIEVGWLGFGSTLVTGCGDHGGAM